MNAVMGGKIWNICLGLYDKRLIGVSERKMEKNLVSILKNKNPYDIITCWLNHAYVYPLPVESSL